MQKTLKVLVFGYFGFETNQLDGQTIKTRNIYELLNLKKDEVGYSLDFFDTQKLGSNKLSIFTMLRKLLWADKIYYLGAHKNLTFIFPFIYLLAFITRKSLHFVVVGGWLVEFIKAKPIHRLMLKNISTIYPETKLMVSQLRSLYGFKNVFQLHNFRIKNNELVDSEINLTGTVRLVFMARVHPMKGVETVLRLPSELDTYKDKFQIDIYGPILDSYKDVFFARLEQLSENISYLGPLQPEDIQRVLSQYDVMLFPTKYFTEGFPGTVLDAYEASLPVVATRWKYAHEYIDDGKSGFVCDFGNHDEFIDKVKMLIEQPQRISELKNGAARKAQEYSPEAAWKILSQDFNRSKK